MKINKQQLVQLNKFLLNRGYQQCDSPYKEEDYSYWKSFRSTSSSLSDYQIAILVYDFGASTDTDPLRFGIQFECIAGQNAPISHFNITLCDMHWNVLLFEQFCQQLYQTLCSMNVNGYCFVEQPKS